jgi:hypothetical protein
VVERIYGLEGFDESDIDVDGDPRTVAWDHEEQLLRVETRDSRGRPVVQHFRLTRVEKRWVAANDARD